MIHTEHLSTKPYTGQYRHCLYIHKNKDAYTLHFKPPREDLIRGEISLIRFVPLSKNPAWKWAFKWDSMWDSKWDNIFLSHLSFELVRAIGAPTLSGTALALSHLKTQLLQWFHQVGQFSRTIGKPCSGPDNGCTYRQN